MSDTPERKAQKKAWYLKNREKVLAQQKEGYQNGLLKPKYKRYYQKNKLHKAMSQRISRWCKHKGGRKQMRAQEYLGYGWNDLKEHLEKLFEPGMNWDNYGEWEIDHVIPASWFELDQYEECFKLENLQPMWGWQNSSKGNHYSGSYVSK